MLLSIVFVTEFLVYCIIETQSPIIFKYVSIVLVVILILVLLKNVDFGGDLQNCVKCDKVIEKYVPKCPYCGNLYKAPKHLLSNGLLQLAIVTIIMFLLGNFICDIR